MTLLPRPMHREEDSCVFGEIMPSLEGDLHEDQGITACCLLDMLVCPVGDAPPAIRHHKAACSLIALVLQSTLHPQPKGSLATCKAEARKSMKPPTL